MGAPRLQRSDWVIETSVQGIVGLDASGVVVRWNPSARRIFGCPSSRALGRPMADLFPSIARPLGKLLADARKARAAYAEASVPRSDRRTAEVAFTAVRTLDPPGVLVVVRDVTERKTAERHLRQTLSALEEAQELAGVASWTWDLAQDRITWSKELYRMLGIDRTVVRTSLRRLLARVPAEDRAAFQAALDATVGHGAPFDLRHHLVGSWGRKIEVHSLGRMIEGSGPRDRRLVGTCRIVAGKSSRENADRALRDQVDVDRRATRRMFFVAEAALLLFESFDYGRALGDLCRRIVPREADRCVVDLREGEGGNVRLSSGPPKLASPPENGAVRRVLSTGEYELHVENSPQKLARVLPDRGAYGLSKTDSAAAVLVVPLRTRAGVVGTVTLVQSESGRRFGSAEVELFQAVAKLAGIAIEHGRLYGEAARLNHELEARVEQRTAELREALRDLDAYASAVAHDLRAPLRALRSFSEMLLEECGAGLDERGRDYAGRICSACVRLDALVMDLLTYSRVSRRDLELGPLGVDSVVDEVLRGMDEEIRQAGAEVRVEAPLGRVRGNRVVLAQVLRNLVSNAIRYVGPGVKPRVRFLGERRDARLRIWVEDNGLGIPVEHQERIFRPFERGTAGASISGTGLGLSIVRRGVERMEGEVGVDSAPGRGSRFWVELPAA